ncbi:non-canonical purine NTP pyrophosphatase [Mycobacterium sp. P7213]|uniref:non-canonical purine NTP pyrophosphatase n=1 Tax=Mycobacterium sp. P7213 TaxID=2478465 RepID=UPI0013DD9B36|nr:non-canonical purine NTP pyrophosphatase [Mycobacterium sp. P7213]
MSDPASIENERRHAAFGSLNVTVDGYASFTVSAEYRLRTSNWPTEGIYIQLNDSKDIELRDAYSIAADVMFATTDALAVTASTPGIPARETQMLIDAGFRWCDTLGEDATIFECPRQMEPLSSFRVRLSDGARQSIDTISRGLVYPLAYFATGSHVKRGQYSYLFRSSGVRLEISDLASSVPEPQVEGQGWGPERILVEDPLRRIARFAARARTYPVLIEDTMLFVEHFNSDFDRDAILPGPDTKRWWRALGSQGVLDLMEHSRRRRAKFVCQLGVLTAEGRYETFRTEKAGAIAEAARALENPDQHFPYTSPYNFHNIFVPEGSESTYAEMYPGEFRSFDYRSACVDQVAPFLRRNGMSPSQLQLFTEAY